MTLVILAAGMGSRYGGLKQIDPITDHGEFIIDFSIYDAVKAGFDRIVLIIKEENYEYFKATVGKRLSQVVPVVYAFQGMNVVPSGFSMPERVKPWGTAHALYCCKDIVADRFAVINADDFYGYESFKLVADFLKNSKDDEFLNAGFLVTNTLSDQGSVKRGILHFVNGYATDLVESEIQVKDGKVIATPLNQDKWSEISANTLVSMNMFGFSKMLMDRIAKDFEIFCLNTLAAYAKNERLKDFVIKIILRLLIRK